LGVWLILATFLLPSIWTTTRWNDIAIGIAIAALSLPTSRSRAHQDS